MLEWPAKDPNEVLDYTVDWAARLASGETISTSNFTVDTPSGLTIQTQNNDTNSATVWLTGGNEGATGEILNRITTSAGRTMDETVLLPIRSR